MFRCFKYTAVFLGLIVPVGCADLEKSVKGLPDDFTRAYEDTKKSILPEEGKPKATAKASESKKSTEPTKAKEPPPPPAPAPPPSPPAPAPPRDLPPAPVKKAPVEEFILHKVAAGETLATIAKWYSGKAAAWREIAAANPGVDPDRLRDGQPLKIPLAIATLHKEPPDHSAAGAAAPAKKSVKEPEAPAKSTEASTKPVFGPK